MRLVFTTAVMAEESILQQQIVVYLPLADPGENLTGALHSNFGRGWRGGCD